jgi:hypothetical protein
VTTTAAHSPASNPDAEQANRTVFAAVRAALAASGLPGTMWPYAAMDAVNKGNFVPKRQPDGTYRAPVIALGAPSLPPSPAHLLPFGQHGYVTVTGDKGKLAPRATLARYLGAPSQHQYAVLLPSGSVTNVRAAEFAPVSAPTSPSPRYAVTRAPIQNACSKQISACAAAAQSSVVPTAPRTLAEARARPDAAEWQRAHDAELRRHDGELRTWTYVEQLPTDRPAPHVVTYRAKTNQYGGLERRKARIALAGNRLRPGVDFDQRRTASHMPSQAGRRFLYAVAAAEGAAVHSWDVPGAYMRAPSDPRYRVTMRQPPNFDGSYAAPGKVCLLRRAMPGAPDANSSWETFRDYWLHQWGWRRVQSEPSMFICEVAPGMYARMSADTDDFLVTAPTDAHLDALARPLLANWQITIQRLSSRSPIVQRGPALPDLAAPASIQHVGLKVERLPDGGIKLSNPKTVAALLHEHGLSECAPAVLPHKISADACLARPGEPMADPTRYRSIVGSLRFLADSTHPLIAFTVGVLGRHLHQPASRHMDMAVHVLRYLQGQRDSGLVFNRASTLHLAAATDSDYASDVDTRRSVSGVLVTVNGQPVFWSSSRQHTVSHSSTEAEYIAADTGARVLVWLAALADDFRVPLARRPTTLTIDDKPAARYHDGRITVDNRADLAIHVDNSGAIDMAYASGPTKRTKHLDVRHHYIQQCVARRVLRLQQCTTDEQLADVFTKPLGRIKFTRAFQLLRVAA